MSIPRALVICAALLAAGCGQGGVADGTPDVNVPGQQPARWVGTWALNPALKPDPESANLQWTLHLDLRKEGFAVVEDIIDKGKTQHSEYFARFDGGWTMDTKSGLEYGMDWLGPGVLKLRYRPPGAPFGISQSYTLSGDGKTLTQRLHGWVFEHKSR